MANGSRNYSNQLQNYLKGGKWTKLTTKRNLGRNNVIQNLAIDHHLVIHQNQLEVRVDLIPRYMMSTC